MTDYAGDSVEPLVDNRPKNQGDPQSARDVISGPTLLDLKPAEAAKRVLSDWDNSYKYVKGLLEQWRANHARSKGYTGVSIVKQQNDAKVYIPTGAKKDAGTMNIAARLKRRLRAYLFADAPIPEATPATDEDDDRDNAETATRVLQHICSEGQGGLSYELAAGNAFDVGSDYASGFVRFWVDPNGSQRPKSLMAAPVPEATAEHPLIDPQTSAPYITAQGQVPDPVIRYIKADGSLTDNKADPNVTYEWLPKVQREILSSRHIRFLPWNCEDLWDADGLMVGVMVPLGQLKRQFPQVAKMPDQELTSLTGSQPTDARILAPRGQQRFLGGSGTGDDQMVFVCSRYHRQSATYPKGAYLVAAGEKTLLYRGELWDDQHGEPLDIPVTQFLQYHEEENPYGTAVMEYLGPGNEILAFLMGVVLDHLDKYTNRKTFVPMHSNLTPEQMQSPAFTLIPIIPGGEPKYEELPDLPPFVEKMIAMQQQDLNDESGLQQTAQGVETSGVKSGIHAQTIIEQVIQGLSELRQHTERGLVRGWRIILQLIRAYYTVPQQVRYQGEDQSYKVQEFTGAELGDTRDVRIQRGSFTQLSPSAKANVAQQLFGITDPATGERIMTAQELRHIIEGNVGGLIATQDNPHMLRVRRQIMKWREGPPEGWQAPQPQQVMGPQGPQMQPPPPDPLLAGIFAIEPPDVEPPVAKVRAFELARAIASVHFGRKPPEWQNGLRQAYEQARQAAGIQTVADQQAAQQQQMQAQQQQAAQQQLAEGQAKQQEVAARQQEAQQAQAFKQQEMQQMQAMKQQERQQQEQDRQAQEAARQPDPQILQALEAQGQQIEQLVAAASQPPVDTGQDDIAQALAAVAEGQQSTAQAIAAMAEGQQAVAQSVEHLGDAVQALAQRPAAFKIKKDKQGKAEGIEPA